MHFYRQELFALLAVFYKLTFILAELWNILIKDNN